MSSLAEQLAELRRQIAEAEQRLADTQLKTMDTRVELATVIADYERIVWPYQNELEEIKQKIADRRGHAPGLSGAPDNYVPANEQYRRAFRPSASDRLPEIEGFQPRTGLARDDASLKKLYRDLALKYHPDLAPDEETRERWTGFMQQINGAYAIGNAAKLEALQAALAREAPPSITRPASTENAPTSMALALIPDEDELSAAQSRLDALAVALQTAEAEFFDLKMRWEMKLSKEITAASDKGRDLLNEIADDLQAQLQKARSELSSLGG